MANQFNPTATSPGPTQTFYISCEVIDENLRRVTHHNGYLQDLLETRDSECDAFRKNISDLKTSLASLQEKLSQNDQQIKDLLNEINTLKANSVLIAQHNEYLEQNNYIARSHAKLSAQNQKLSKEAGQLKHNVNREKEKNVELQRHYDFLNHIKNNLIEQINGVRQSFETEQGKVKVLEETLTSSENFFKEKEEGLQRCLTEANEEILQINSKLNVLSRDYDSLVCENEKLLDQIKNFEREKETEEALNLKNQAEVDDLKEKLEQAKTALQESERRNQILQEELENVNISSNEKTKRLEEIVNAQREKVQELEEQIRSSGNLDKVMVEELQKDLCETRVQIAELNSNLKLSSSENNFLILENKGLLKKVEKLKSERNKLESEIEHFNVKHQEEINILKEQLNETAVELQKSEEYNQNLEQELNRFVAQKPVQSNDQYVRLSKRTDGRRVRMLLSEVQELVIAENSSENELCLQMGHNGESSSNGMPNSTIPPMILTRVDEINWAASDKCLGTKIVMAKYQDLKYNSELVEHLTRNNRKLLRTNENLKVSAEKHLEEKKALEEKLTCAEDRHKKEVQVLDEEFKHADSRALILSTKLQSVSDDLEELKNDNKNLSYKVEDLEAEKKENQEEIGKLKEQLAKSEKQLNSHVGECNNSKLLQSRYDALKRANNSLHKKLTNIFTELKKTKDYARYITEIVQKQDIRLRQWNIDDENAESHRRKHTIIDLTEKYTKSEDNAKKQSALINKMKTKMDSLTKENKTLHEKLNAVLATQPKKQKLDKLVNHLRNTREESKNAEEDLDFGEEPLCLIIRKSNNSCINKIGEDKSKGMPIPNGNVRVCDNQQRASNIEDDSDDERPLNLKRARRDETLAHALPIKKRNGLS
ncbi:unnamed protein product [Orchesella dallaii]|uniref:Uncharacterized protein n=1 Tax=Orchesella dallaii TaxID=48710 RepID=A0ABP1RHV6_9HEXA